MNKLISFKISSLFFVLITFSLASNAQTSITWDEWQVPHITSDNVDSLYFHLGFAQMELHANLILKNYGQSRGKASEYWGSEHNGKDHLIWKLNIPYRASEWYDLQSDENKRTINAFVDGINHFASVNPDRINSEMKQVLPVKVEDIFSFLQTSYHLNVGAFNLQSNLENWKSAGSNAWAISPEKSASGNSMLMMQPHPPWLDEYRFTEFHLTHPEFNVYGIATVGQPTIAMGFNEHLGWGLTFNQVDAHDLIEVEKKEDGYLFDGEILKFDSTPYQFTTNDESGTRIEEGFIKKSIHGYVIEETQETALILRLSGLDRPFMADQFFNMMKSENRQQFEEALTSLQLPLQNIVYADKAGEILYVYNGIVPKRSIDNYGYWNQILDGSDPNNLVQEYFEYSELPKFANPTSGFIANANNSPRTSTFPFEIQLGQYPFYLAPPYMDLRAQNSLKLLSSKPKISFDDIERLQASTHNYLADLVIDDLIEFYNSSTDSLINVAISILKNWDKTMDHNSVGSALFSEWFMNQQDIFVNPWNPGAPMDTPNTLSFEAKNAFKETVYRFNDTYADLSLSWGDIHLINFNGNMYPSNLGLGEMGAIHAGFYHPLPNGRKILIGGVSYSLIVEFGEEIQAKALMPYGNSTENPSSKQLEMMLSKQLRTVNFEN